MFSNKLLVVRLLFLSPFPPRPLYGGAVVRNHYLARSLAAKHRVWASFCGVHGSEQFEAEIPLVKEGLLALFDPRFLVRAYRTIRREKLEAIVSTSLIAGLHGALLKLMTGLPFWMDEHNVEWHCSRRYGHRFWWLIFLLEGFILRQADYVTCVSEEDRERLLNHFRLPPSRVTVAPNGVDSQNLAKPAPTSKQKPEKKKLLFFGVLSYPPNAEAVRYLAKEIEPRLEDNTEIIIAGTGGEELKKAHQNLKFLGFVDDIHALIRSCDAVVVPIFAGGGTRMKILETVACGVPVVSTSCGAEGIELEALGDSITIADETSSILKWIEALPVQNTVRVPDQFFELYDWDRIWQNKAPL